MRSPSPALLHYLKAQSDICFFSSNPSSIVHNAVPRPRHLRPTGCASPALEAGFLKLDFLWPRSLSKSCTQKQPVEARFAASNGLFRNRVSLIAQRSSSTGSRKWHQKLWGATRLRVGRPLRPDDLPNSLHGSEEGNDTSMFSLGRHISAKAAAQPKLRCTELDENGNVVLTNGEFKKSELIAKVQKEIMHTVLLLIVM
jgi:magnesium transporter